MRRILFFFLLICISVSLFVFLYFNITDKEASAEAFNTVDTNALSQQSQIVDSQAVTIVDLYAQKGSVVNPEYKKFVDIKNQDEAVLNFLLNAPRSTATENEKIIPQNTTFVLDKKFDSHYSFDQKVANIPVYNAALSVHLNPDNTVYALSGNFVNSQVLEETHISEETAKRIALQTAQSQEPSFNDLQVRASKKVIFNFKLFGIGEDERNHVALAVTVNSIKSLFSTEYLVNLKDGSILHVEPHIHEALSRRINDCASGSCQQVRVEGGAEVANNPDANNAYDELGQVYNFYKDNFGWDAWNGQGATMIGNVRQQAGVPCPNAYWNGSSMNMCPGMVYLDVTAHEITHGVNQATARLPNTYQGGALNESIADVMASGLDNNWQIGEEVRATGLTGPLRDMKDPTAHSGRLGPQPDRLFSSNYLCEPSNSGQCGSANDNCGVHHNDGIFNKAFYLMTDGDSFNGCTIRGIGREKSHFIMFQTQKNYLNASANFYKMYTGFTTACNKLAEAGNDTTKNPKNITAADCAEVEKAFQATEMDQQPATSSIGAKCAPNNQTARPPACASGGNPVATATTTPTQPQTTITITTTPQPIPTQVVSASRNTYVAQGAANNNFSTENQMMIGYVSTGTLPLQAVRGLVKFDLQTIPAGKKLKKASLKLYRTSVASYVEDVSKTMSIGVYKVNSVWQDTVTWSNLSTLNVESQATATQTIPGPVPAATAAERWSSWDITSTVQSWYDQPSSNNGLLLKGDETPAAASSLSNPIKSFNAKSCPESICGGNIPKLELEFEDAGTSVTPTVQPSNGVVLNLKLRFQGVTSQPQENMNALRVQVELQAENGEMKKEAADFKADRNGVWIGSVNFNSAAGKYRVLVKGPKHIRKKICTNNIAEEKPGGYFCEGDSWLILNKGSNELNFGGVIVLVGDLPLQDGVVNSYDLSLVRNNLGSKSSNALFAADLNADGIVDTQDYSLILAALSVKYDESE